MACAVLTEHAGEVAVLHLNALVNSFSSWILALILLVDCILSASSLQVYAFMHVRTACTKSLIHVAQCNWHCHTLGMECELAHLKVCTWLYEASWRMSVCVTHSALCFKLLFFTFRINCDKGLINIVDSENYIS